MTICNMTIISENLKYDYLQYNYFLRKFEELWLFAIRVIFLVLTIIGLFAISRAGMICVKFLMLEFSNFSTLDKKRVKKSPILGSFFENPLSLNSHIPKYDYLNMTIILKKYWIWLFAIWLFLEKNWRNMTICNTSNIFSFDDSRVNLQLRGQNIIFRC